MTARRSMAGHCVRPDSATSTITIQLGYYDKDDDGGKAGNPFLAESVTVIEPAVIFDTNVTRRFGYSVTLSYDDV